MINVDDQKFYEHEIREIELGMYVLEMNQLVSLSEFGLFLFVLRNITKLRLGHYKNQC
jgi:hypothetical protein